MKDKKEKGSITLYVLIACIFFVVILSLVYINVVHKKQVQEENIEIIKENYEKNISSIQDRI